jgi:hypothetical protein
VLPDHIASFSTVVPSVDGEARSCAAPELNLAPRSQDSIHLREGAAPGLARKQRQGNDKRVGEQQPPDIRREDVAPRPRCGPPPPAGRPLEREAKGGGVANPVRYPATMSAACSMGDLATSLAPRGHSPGCHGPPEEPARTPPRPSELTCPMLRVRNFAVNRSVTAVTDLTAAAR